MLPEPETLDSILRALRSIDASFQIVCDLRGLQNIYNDIPEAIQVLSRFDAHLIARPNEVDFLDEKFGKALHLLRTNGPPIALRYGPIGLLPFLADDWASDNDWKPFARIAGSALPSQQEWEYLKEKNPTINNIFSGLEDLHENWNACRADMRTYPSSPGGREVTQRRYLTHFIANRGRRSLLSELCVQQTSAGLLVYRFTKT